MLYCWPVIDLAARLAPWVRGRVLLALLALGLVFNLVLFPWRTGELRALSGLEEPTLDARLTYTVETAYAVADALGPQGRAQYALSELSLDLVYPLLYGLFLSLLSVWLLRRLVLPGSGWLRLAWLPFAVVACDYAENVGIVQLLLTYPARTPAVAQVTSLFTTSKWTLAALAIGVNLVLAVLAAIREFAGKTSVPTLKS